MEKILLFILMCLILVVMVYMGYYAIKKFWEHFDKMYMPELGSNNSEPKSKYRSHGDVSAAVKIKRIINKEDVTLDLIEAFLKNPWGALGEPEKCTVVVDYAQTVEQMGEDGHYDYVDWYHVNSNDYPHDKSAGKKTVVIKIFHPNLEMNDEEIISAMKKKGLRPATNAELLALGRDYPHILWPRTVYQLGTPRYNSYGQSYYTFLSTILHDGKLNRRLYQCFGVNKENKFDHKIHSFAAVKDNE